MKGGVKDGEIQRSGGGRGEVLEKLPSHSSKSLGEGSSGIQWDAHKNTNFSERKHARRLGVMDNGLNFRSNRVGSSRALIDGKDMAYTKGRYQSCIPKSIESKPKGEGEGEREERERNAVGERRLRL